MAATGVATREESGPEQLDTAVLGLTLVFGVERPPSELELSWRVFPTAGMVVPAVWAGPTGSERVTLSREQATLHMGGGGWFGLSIEFEIHKSHCRI